MGDHGWGGAGHRYSRHWSDGIIEPTLDLQWGTNGRCSVSSFSASYPVGRGMEPRRCSLDAGPLAISGYVAVRARLERRSKSYGNSATVRHRLGQN